jgi:hypothetical protein
MLGETKRVCVVSLSTEIKIVVDGVETSFGIEVDRQDSCLIAEE